MRSPLVHVFVVGRQSAPTIAAARAVVQDWSAVGLVGPSVWIDPGVEPADSVTGLRIANGLAVRVELRSWMPRNPGSVRVLSLQSLVDPDGTTQVGDVQGFLQSVRLPPNTPLVNLLVPAEGTEAVVPDAIFDSQLNVLVQPVDGADPQAAIEPLSASSPTFAMHAAAALCTGAGLWTGMAAGPLDREPPWAGPIVAVGRAYLRRLDATPVLDRLADEVYGTGGTLPQTWTQFNEPMGVVLPSAQLAAAEAAGYAVLAKHSEHTRFHAPEPFRPAPLRKRGLGETLRLFFTFLRRAVAGAPQAWLNDVLLAAGRKVESGATNFFYGQDSGFQVVVTGLAAGDRTGADQAGALQDAAAGMLSRIAPGTPAPVTQVPRLWDDTVRTVAALADGGDPDPAIPLPGHGARLVIDNPRMLCTQPGDQPFRVPHGLPGSESGPIEPSDPWHALCVEQALDGYAREAQRTAGHPGQVDRMATIAQLRHQLAAWVGERRSAMWAISHGLATELGRALGAHREIMAAGSTRDDTDQDDARAAQRRVRAGVLIWLLVMLLVIAVAVVLRVVGTISTNVGVAIVVAALLVCLVGAFLTFASGQRALWRTIHRIEVAGQRRQWLAGNAVKVTQEMWRLSSIYRQSRVWAQIVAEYVNAPFGTPGRPPEQQTVSPRLTGDLPLAVAVATATYSPREHEPVVYQARGQLLRKDWLATSIDQRRRVALDRIREQTGRHLEDRLASDADLLPGGPLLSYLEVLRQPEMKALARDIALTRLVDRIRNAGLGERLLPAVKVEAGAIRAESWAAMTGALLTPQGQLSYDGFSPTGITNRAPTLGRSFVATDTSVTVAPPLLPLPTTPTGGRQQLDRFIARWDLTYPVAAEDLGYFGSPGGEPSPAPAPEQIIDVPS